MVNFTLVSKSRLALEAYEKVCQPVCKEMGLPMPALDLLMTIDENPEKCSAKEIGDMRKIKQNMISFYVDKLVEGGYLERQAVKNDRRKIKLVCTEKAKPIIEFGKQLQADYIKRICEGITDEEINEFLIVLHKIENNMNEIMKDKKI